MATQDLTKKLDKVAARKDGGSLDLGLRADSKVLAAVVALEAKKKLKKATLSGYVNGTVGYNYGAGGPEYSASAGMRVTW